MKEEYEEAAVVGEEGTMAEGEEPAEGRNCWRKERCRLSTKMY